MIYLVEDDANIRELVTYTLNHSGLDATGFAETLRKNIKDKRYGLAYAIEELQIEHLQRSVSENALSIDFKYNSAL